MAALDALTPALLATAVRGLVTYERWRTGVGFNPLGDAQVDPYPYLDDLRERDPVHWSYVLRGWLLSRFEDCSDFLRDHATSKEMAHSRRRSPMADPRFERGFDDTPSMLVVDPPEHTRLRGLVGQAFTPRTVARLRPRIETITADLLDAALPAGAEGGTFDLVPALANQLPVIVIAELLGVPPEDRGRFRAWSDEIAEGLTFDPTGRRFEAMRAALERLGGYLAGVVEERRRAPREDLISALVAVEERGQRLTHAEVLATLRLLLVAGSETTTNLIGNGMLALLRHPAQLARLRAEPSLLPSAIEELLRFDPPVQAVRRIAMRDFELHGRHIRSGDAVVCLLGAANRDPRAFEEPRRLDVARADNRHLAFGFGIHYCLGAPLARLEGEVAFRMLLERYPEMHLAGAPYWRDMRSLRGLARLPVRVRTRAPLEHAAPASTGATAVG